MWVFIAVWLAASALLALLLGFTAKFAAIQERAMSANHNPNAFNNRNDVRSRQAKFDAKPKCHALFDDGRTYCMRAFDNEEANSLVMDHVKRNRKAFDRVHYTIEKGWPNA